MAKNKHHATANPKPAAVTAAPLKKKSLLQKLVIPVLLAAIIIVIVISCLPGASNSPLSEDVRNQISEKWLSNYAWHWADNGAVNGCRYYGQFNGYEIIFRPYTSMEPLNLVIADQTFSFNNEFELFGFKNGKITSLSDLYKEGKFTMSEVAAIAAVHNSESWPVLSQELRQQIETCWHNENTVLIWDSGAYVKRSTRYYGTHEGYVFFLNVNAIPPESLGYYRFKIGDSTFEMSCSATIYGYKDGQIYRMQDLYNDGLIAAKTITAIAKTHAENES